MRAGAISFDKVEVKFILDEQNNPEGVYFKESKDANKLIEEFMLLANRSVAEFIGKQEPKKTFVYRVHDEPDDEKIAALENIIKRFGYKLNTKDRHSTAQSMNKLLKDVHGKKEQNLIDTLAIRSMSKAMYTTHNIGHYGLALIIIHIYFTYSSVPGCNGSRLLQHYLDNGKSAKEEEYEENAAQQRHGKSCHKCRARQHQIYAGEVYADQKTKIFGVISGVTEWEFMLKLCRINVKEWSFAGFKDDRYEFDREEYAVIGNVQKTFTNWR